MPVGERQILWADGPHRIPVGAVDVVPAKFARTEEEVEGVGGGGVERTRPIVAAEAGIAELRTIAAAGGRQEDAVAVHAFHFVAVLAVLSGPCPGAVV